MAPSLLAAADAIRATVPAMRIAVRYEGRVQGVGFRATVREIARRHEVAGWVRNEPDGSVLMEAEGEPAELLRLREAVRAVMKTFIAQELAETMPSDAGYTGFEIRR